MQVSSRIHNIDKSARIGDSGASNVKLDSFDVVLSGESICTSFVVKACRIVIEGILYGTGWYSI